MKTRYAKFFIGTIMALGGGRAAAQVWSGPEIPKEIAIKYIKELSQSRSAKLDTIYKYRDNNLYKSLVCTLKKQNRLCSAEAKPNSTAIIKLYKKLFHTTTESERKILREQLIAQQKEFNYKYEYYNNIKNMYIDDAFVKCLMYAEQARRR